MRLNRSWVSIALMSVVGGGEGGAPVAAVVEGGEGGAPVAAVVERAPLVRCIDDEGCGWVGAWQKCGEGPVEELGCLACGAAVVDVVE